MRRVRAFTVIGLFAYGKNITVALALPLGSSDKSYVGAVP